MYRKTNTKSSLLIAGIIIFIINTVILVGFTKSFYKSWQSLSWIESSALITQLGQPETSPWEQNKHPKYIVTYQYNYDGEVYSNDTISYFSNYKSQSGKWDTVRKELEEANQNNTPITVFINPNDPSESIIDKYYNYSLVFGLLIGLLSFYLLAYLISRDWLNRFITNKHRKRQIDNHPLKPWFWRKEWIKKTISPNNSMDLKFVFSITLLITLFTVSLLLLLKDKDSNLMLVTLSIIFSSAGIIALIYLLFRRMKYGYSELELTPHPFFTGQTNQGQLLVKRGNLKEHDIIVTLECRLVSIDYSGMKPMPKIKVLWSDKTYANIESVNHKAFLLEFSFTIPAALPDSGNNLSDECHQWVLEVKADTLGIDLYKRYEIPVFNYSHRKTFLKFNHALQE
ncbi:DUF3592 domain-containing protein [Kangiella profundi]|nr:DUF3592 domain-containing protein [Kangiella profundi]GGE97694.1 hypothetical protein GCM10011356_09330 [Kangiella profundi]